MILYHTVFRICENLCQWSQQGPIAELMLYTPKNWKCSDITSVANGACCKLIPVIKDLTENLFECPPSRLSRRHCYFSHLLELTFHVNTGIDDVLDAVCPLLLKHSDIVMPGDFVQLAGAVSLTRCNGAPRAKFLMDRPQPKAAAPNLLVPEPFDSVQTILQRFGELGFTKEETVAVIGGSHSVAGADDIVPNEQGAIPFSHGPATLPCAASPFPTLSTQPGPVTSVPAILQADDS
ncbi:hypothetical protein D9613_004612 [Agrocybe pediades]|uniref:Peroxidase n=1 Tax=Agrocybe pediades TaxID=84607 RepID=A0A8H4QIN5_9AGAR|nr:hypothetical protein D9613_004612 [Agrocybe pediades]